jgi:hypothetical protein
VFLALFSVLIVAQGAIYSVSLDRANDGNFFLSNSTSDWMYNYNAAYIPIPESKGKYSDALAVRVQNLIDPKNPYSVGPSKIVFTERKAEYSFNDVETKYVILDPADEPY